MAFTAKTEINGRSYAMIRMGAFKSISVATRLGKALANGAAGEADTVAVAILGSLDEEMMTTTVADLCENISCEGKALEVDTFFMEHQEDLLPILAWSLKENVMGFFTENALKALSSVMESLTSED